MKKLLKKLICKLSSHKYDETWICTRCHHYCTVKEYPGLAVPNIIVMRAYREDYIDLLPPIQKIVKDVEHEEEK